MRNQTFNRQNFVVSIVLYLFILVFIGVRAAKLFLLVLFFVFVALELMVQIKKWRSEREFRRQFLLFIHQLALNMQMGSAFRTSYKDSLPFFKGNFRKKLEDIFQFVTFSQHYSSESTNNFEKRVVEELVRVDKDEKQSRKRILNFKTALEVEEFFRHRSKQMAHGVRFQLFVLSVIYFGIVFFVLMQGSWSELRGMFFCSFALFLTGCGLFFQLGGKKKWRL